MERVDIKTAKWIAAGKVPYDFARRSGFTIAHVMPALFAGYCKLLHPFEVDAIAPETLAPNPGYGKPVSIAFTNMPDGDLKITEQQSDGTMIDLFEKHQQWQKEYNAKTLTPVAWRFVANKYGLAFHSQINTKSFAARFQQIGWPQNLLFPREGRLPRFVFIQLLRSLKKRSSVNAVCIYQMQPHAIHAYEELVKASFEEVLDYFADDFVGYLYAADRSWIVYTDTDLHFTIIGGSKEMLTEIAQSGLEVVACDATTRIDDNRDDVNEKETRITIDDADGCAKEQALRTTVFTRLRKFINRKRY